LQARHQSIVDRLLVRRLLALAGQHMPKEPIYLIGIHLSDDFALDGVLRST
jgi:hypothetical protein